MMVQSYTISRMCLENINDQKFTDGAYPRLLYKHEESMEKPIFTIFKLVKLFSSYLLVINMSFKRTHKLLGLLMLLIVALIFPPVLIHAESRRENVGNQEVGR